jgi:acyl-CoA dehydrogenase
MPFMGMVTGSLVMGIADGPTEVHKVTVAKQVLRDYTPDNDLFPAYHLPKLREAAQDKYAGELEELKAHYAARKAQTVEA